ncbi:MAG: flavodoxin family protein [Patescibacteria group bacterium]|jgi:flavodoxin
MKNLSVKHEVIMQRAEKVNPSDLEQYKLVIFGSPTWESNGKDAVPHEFMMDLLRRVAAERIIPKQYTVFGCGNRSFTNFCGAVDYIDAALRSLGSKKIFPTLKLDGYYLDLSLNQKLVDGWTAKLLTEI